MGFLKLIVGSPVTEIRLPLCQVWSLNLKVKTVETILGNLIPLRMPGPVQVVVYLAVMVVDLVLRVNCS